MKKCRLMQSRFIALLFLHSFYVTAATLQKNTIILKYKLIYALMTDTYLMILF